MLLLLSHLVSQARISLVGGASWNTSDGELFVDGSFLLGLSVVGVLLHLLASIRSHSVVTSRGLISRFTGQIELQVVGSRRPVVATS